MHIAVISVLALETFPPAVALINSLIELGHRVTVVSYDSKVLNTWRGNDAMVHVSLGRKEQSKLRKIEQSLKARNRLRSFLRDAKTGIDLVWAVSDTSAREAGSALRNYIYVISLAELVESVPSLANGIFPTYMPVIFKDGTVKQLCKDASRVVVPEYNRAHIQKTMWDLPKVPHVLPNKQTPPDTFLQDPQTDELHRQMKSEKRTILLYQGIFAVDRDFEPLVESMDILGGDYVLYLFGRATSMPEKEVKRLVTGRDNVIYCGFFPAPSHLQFTRYASIGLLPYVPAKKGLHSPLNALYCAPNKIWEYSYYGVPMLGSDVPGLTAQFEKWGMGVTTDTGSPTRISEAVHDIESCCGQMRENARRFYDSLDFTGEVSRIIDEAISGEYR